MQVRITEYLKASQNAIYLFKVIFLKKSSVMLSILLSMDNKFFIYVFVYLFGFISIANAQETAQNSNHKNELLLMSNPLPSDNIQTKVRQANFIFKIDYPANNEASFTVKDAQKLQEFLTYGDQLISCNQEEQSVISQATNPNEAQFVSVIDELQMAGYRVNDLVCSTDNIVFAIDKFLDSDCTDCKQTEISKELLDKFKDVDYGGDLIDLGFNANDSQREDGQLNSFELPTSNPYQGQLEEVPVEPVIINQPQPAP